MDATLWNNMTLVPEVMSLVQANFEVEVRRTCLTLSTDYASSVQTCPVLFAIVFWCVYPFFLFFFFHSLSSELDAIFGPNKDDEALFGARVFRPLVSALEIHSYTVSHNCSAVLKWCSPWELQCFEDAFSDSPMIMFPFHTIQKLILGSLVSIPLHPDFYVSLQSPIFYCLQLLHHLFLHFLT